MTYEEADARPSRQAQLREDHIFSAGAANVGHCRQAKRSADHIVSNGDADARHCR